MEHNETNSDGTHSGYIGMVRTFMRTGLQPPPVPISLRPKVVAQGKWCWGTRQVNPFGMYQLDTNFLMEVMSPRTTEYVALAHAGHGLNSYGLQFALVYGPLAVIVQNDFGGVYGDDRDIACISETYDLVNKLLPLVPEVLADRFHYKRLVLIWSGFRGVSQYTIQDSIRFQRQIERMCGRSRKGYDGPSPSDTFDSSGIMTADKPGEWQKIGQQKQLFAEAKAQLKKLVREAS